MKKITLLFGILFCTFSLSLTTIPSTVSFAAKKTTTKKAGKKKAKKKKKVKKVTITFSKSTDTIENGKKFKFKAKVKNAKASKIIWKSSNPSIISIGKKTGKATAKKPGKTTITATLGKKLVRRTVTVSPSIQNLINANNTYENLKSGSVTSIYSSAASNSIEENNNTIYQEYSCLDENKNLVLYQTVEDSYFSYITNGTKYQLDIAGDKEVTSEAFLESEHPNNNFIHYSNMELVSAELEPDNTYHLVYMADIAGMAEEEQTSVGLDSGICVLDIKADQKNLFVQSYKITNYGSDGARATTVTGTFVYNEENELTLPDEIQNIVNNTNTTTENANTEENTDNSNVPIDTTNPIPEA